MKCNKTPLKLQEANKFLLRIPAKQTGQVPVRKYWCGQHKAWHITSKPQRGKRNSGRQR